MAFSAATAVLVYLVAEAICTSVLPRPAGSIGSDTFAIQEDTGGFVFDPVLGYRVTKTPARIARVTNGQIEYVGRFVGNAQGFQGTRDFTPTKRPGIKRILVFGDSFTSSASLETRWTERVEASLQNTEVYNMAIDGAGLANWWSALARFVQPEKYEFDEVIFATITHDLHRKFAIADYRCGGFLVLGYTDWRPEKFPTDLRFGWQTSSTLTVIPADNFDLSVKERRLCEGDNPNRSRRPWLASQAASLVRKWIPSAAADVAPQNTAQAPKVRPAKADKSFTAEQAALILDLRDRLAGTSIVVIHIPHREMMISHQDDAGEVREFAKLIGGRFIEGADAYRGLGESEIRACYFPHDGHWNQQGSDRFAAFIADELRDR